MLKYLILSLSFFCGAVVFAQAVVPPFWDEIQAFKREDSVKTPPEGAILFTGSSSFRMWTGVQEAFPEHRIVNRAFGGSTFPDVIRYADEAILAYKPKQVVIYCGDNDLASSDTVTAQAVYRRFVQLFTIIRTALPKTSVVFVAIKPSPSRAHLMPRIEEANALIKAFLRRKRRTAYVDIYHPMLQASGQPRPELFLEDNLHMNSQGYQIWQQRLKPVLLK